MRHQTLPSEGNLLVAGLVAAEAASSSFVVAFGSEQFQTVDSDDRLAALFAAVAVVPAVQFEAADDPQQGPFLDVVRCDLGLLAPDFKVELVGLIVPAAPVDGHGEVGNNAA